MTITFAEKQKLSIPLGRLGRGEVAAGAPLRQVLRDLLHPIRRRLRQGREQREALALSEPRHPRRGPDADLVGAEGNPFTDRVLAAKGRNNYPAPLNTMIDTSWGCHTTLDMPTSF